MNNNASGANSYPPKAPMGASRPGAQTNAPPATNMASGAGAGGMAARRPAPPTPGYANSNARPMPGGAAPGAGMHAPAAAPAAPAAPPMPPIGAGGPTLFLIYNGQRYAVTKDQFIIGRGSKTSDLPIKDGNISRKHAAVIRRNGTFYIKDLGSTNGIDYKGMRIDNKRIDEGDVFHLCDYELRFTYRAD
jgi:hypothetical protein